MDDHLYESAAALEKKYDCVKKGKEDLEVKLNKAISLRDNISQLKSAKGFLSHSDLSQLDDDISNQKLILHNSSIAESNVKLLEEKIAVIESSGVLVSPMKNVQIRHRIEAMQNSIASANNIQEKISKSETDAGFCSKEEIDKLQRELNAVLMVLKRCHPLKPGKYAQIQIIHQKSLSFKSIFAL